MLYVVRVCTALDLTLCACGCSRTCVLYALKVHLRHVTGPSCVCVLLILTYFVLRLY